MMETSFFIKTTILLFFLSALGCKTLSIGTQEISDSEKISENQYTENNVLAEYLRKMSIEEKKGLLTMVSIKDTILTDNTIYFLKDNNIKSIILFNHNIINENQLRQLTKDLREKVSTNILIAIDQEGGEVNRILWDKNKNISARFIGSKNDYSFAYKIALERSKFLLDLGINVILGPVCDVAPSNKSYIYERSFGTDPEVVTKMVEATVKAQKDAGIITVLKHFPGHGRTEVDSHVQFPVINIDLESLYKFDLKPFIKGIETGAEFVMLGHIINKNIDSEKPASLSQKYIDLLNKLDFKGLVITDDLSMTGKITGGIGWGINLISGDFDLIKRQMVAIEPLDYYCGRLLKIKENIGVQ